jgi:hypothetical protein
MARPRQYRPEAPSLHQGRRCVRHATPASAKATAAAVGTFFLLAIAATIVYALVAG